MPVQRALSRAILAAASREYVFVDEWDVAAPREAVFAAIADARTYPEWWKPVYIEVDADGEPALGKESRQHFKGRLPYHLHTRSRIVALDAPHVIEGEVDGDLRGHGRWTLTDAPGGGTHVRFDWRVHADRRLLRVLTPVLRPALRWNHAWAIARAVEGLEPYARARSATPSRGRSAAPRPRPPPSRGWRRTGRRLRPTASPPGSVSVPAGRSIRRGVRRQRGTAYSAPSREPPSSESWSISSTYSVPSLPNARSIAFVKPGASVRSNTPVRGSRRNTCAPPTGNGKPVSWLT